MAWTTESPLRIERRERSVAQTLTEAEVQFLVEELPRSFRYPPVTLERVRGGTRLKAGKYVGAIGLPSGRRIEIAPPCSPANFAWQLAYAHDVDATLIDERTDVATGDVALSAFVALYLAELEALIDGGLRRGYRRVERTSDRLRGNLDVQRQLRRHGPAATAFECRHDELTYETTVNCAVRQATERLAAVTDDEGFQSRLRHHAAVLRDRVGDRRVRPVDVERIELSRLERGYADVLPLVEAVLRGSYVGDPAGDARQSYSFLVPYWEVFENLVERAFEAIVGPREGLRVVTDENETAMSGFLTGGHFRMKPDVVVETAAGDPVFVADAKSKDQWTKPSNADMYQIASYLMATEAPGALVYPGQSFEHDAYRVDDEHPLRVIALPTDRDQGSYERFVDDVERRLERAIEQYLDERQESGDGIS